MGWATVVLMREIIWFRAAGDDEGETLFCMIDRCLAVSLRATANPFLAGAPIPEIWYSFVQWAQYRFSAPEQVM